MRAESKTAIRPLIGRRNDDAEIKFAIVNMVNQGLKQIKDAKHIRFPRSTVRMVIKN